MPVTTQILYARIARKSTRDTKKYQPVSSEITVQNGLLLRGQRIIIPQALQMEMLERLHEGHLGLVKCPRRASQSVWWPGLGNQIEELIVNCSTCRQHEHNRAEPLLPSEIPIYPWQKVATDLLEYKKAQYVVLV